MGSSKLGAKYVPFPGEVQNFHDSGRGRVLDPTLGVYHLLPEPTLPLLPLVPRGLTTHHVQHQRLCRWLWAGVSQ